METIFVLNIATLRGVVKDCIDRPSTLSERMTQNCRVGDKAATTLILQEILDKLSRHEDDSKATVSTLPVDLNSLVKDVVVSIQEVISEVEKRLSKNTVPAIFRFFEKRSFRTKETISKTLFKDLERKIKALRDVINYHQKLIGVIQKAQQKCWIGMSKVNKYKLMLETARASREHLKDQLSRRGLKTRDNAIRNLEKTLKIKEERYDSATMAYCKLKCQVEATARQMKQHRDDLHNRITSELLDRMEGTLISLTTLSKTYLSEESQKLMSKKFEVIDLRAILRSVLLQGQTVYTYPDPCEYTRIHGFDKQIPKAIYYQRTERKTNSHEKYHEHPISVSE